MKSIRRRSSSCPMRTIKAIKLHFRSCSSDRTEDKKYLKAKDTIPPKSTPVRIHKDDNTLTVHKTFGDYVSSLRRSPSPTIRRVLSPRKDRRPLTNNDYQMTLLNKIDSFFYVNCSRMLNSNGSLKPITLKMFVEVSSFLLKYLGIKQGLTVTNYVDELPKCAEKLRYPGMMTKSWLKIANTTHSWPYVLGWIDWLVEACQVREIALNTYELENLPFIGTQQQVQSSSMEFQALLECYKAYNEERCDDEEKLLNRYLQNVLVQKGITDDGITQARKELKKEKMKLQIHEKESQKLDEKIEYLQQKLASLRVKESKQLDNINIMEEYVNLISTKTNQLNTKRKILKEQIRRENIRYEKLISIVKNQPMSKTENKNIIINCTELQNYNHLFNDHLKDYQEELHILDIKLASLSNNLNKVILEYNKKVFMHIESDIDINFNELKLPEKDLMHSQMMEIMTEKAVLITTFKEKLQEKIKSLSD